MTEDSLEKQRQRLIVRLTELRERYTQCVADVPVEVATRGSEWSIVDLLRHTTGGGYRTMLTRLLKEDNPKMSGFDADANWRRVVDSILTDIDEVIKVASDLTVEELGRSGQRGDQAIGVIEVLTLTANHYDEHLRQLIEEVRPREGLPQV
jgi:hypothetical protein